MLPVNPLPAGCVQECLGCPHREWSREESLAQKEAFVRLHLGSFTHRLESIRSVSDQDRLNYRDRAVLALDWLEAERRWKVGLRGRKKNPRDFKEKPPVIEISSCPVHTARIRAGMRLMTTQLPGAGVLPLTHAVISGALVTLVVKAKRAEVADATVKRVAALLWDEAGFEGVFIDFHPSAGNRVLSSSGGTLIWGREQSEVAGFTHGPSAFLQLLPTLHAESLTEAFASIVTAQPDIGVDLYCGIGASLRRWGDLPVLGIELSGEAVRLARMNAPKAQVLQGKCSERLPQIQDWIQKSKRVAVYLNPPRMGLEPEVLRWLQGESRIAAISLLSCSPESLARDVRALVNDGGFQLERLVPYDFFPQARNVEVLVTLKR